VAVCTIIEVVVSSYGLEDYQEAVIVADAIVAKDLFSGWKLFFLLL